MKDGYKPNLNEQNGINRRDFLAGGLKVGAAAALGLGTLAAGCASTGRDLNRYRTYAVKEGSRESLENLEQAMQDAGMAFEGAINVATLSYGTDMYEPLRANDFKDPFWQANNEKALEQAGVAFHQIGKLLYAILDFAAFDKLPDLEDKLYREVDPATRPFVHGGKAVGEIWKTIGKIGNIATFGLFDNVSKPAGDTIYGILETLKGAAQAVGNSPRGPVYLITGENEGLAKIADWAVLVPTEYVSNVLQVQGIKNVQDIAFYENALGDKGVIGTYLELGGSGFILFKGADKLDDYKISKWQLKKKSKKERLTGEESSPGTPGKWKKP